MLQIFISLFGVPRVVKRDLAFPQMIRYDSGSSIKLLQSKMSIILISCDAISHSDVAFF